jgi:hypothetical protein
MARSAARIADVGGPEQWGGMPVVPGPGLHVDVTPEQLLSGYPRPEQLFEALDGQSVSSGGQRWLIEVYSVTELAGARWVQLGLHGEHERSMTLKLPQGGDEREAMEALAAQLAAPATLFEGLEVA